MLVFEGAELGFGVEESVAEHVDLGFEFVLAGLGLGDLLAEDLFEGRLGARDRVGVSSLEEQRVGRPSRRRSRIFVVVVVVVT